MRKIIKNEIFAFLALAVLLVANMPAANAGYFKDVEASAALLAEMDSGVVLYEYNKDQKHPADALAKVMTLLLAVSACENGIVSPNRMIEMTESAYSDIDALNTTQNIQPGEKMTMLNLMYCAYIGGADEACNLLAEQISGSARTFVTSMNARAKELGCQNTNFTNPHGRYNSNQYTTAMDQFIIYREALSHPLFVEISGTYRYETDATNMADRRRMSNSNELVNPNSKYYYRQCTSGAASATYEGGYSSVSFAEANDLSLICVILGAEDLYLSDDSVDLRNLSEACRLFELGFTQFSWRTILSSTELIDKAPVMHGAGADFVNLHPESSITRLLNNAIPDEAFKKTVKIYSVANGETLIAPIHAGDVLGEVTVTRDGEDYGTVLLVANTSIDLHRVQFIKMQISDMLSSTIARRVIWVLVIFILLYLTLVIRYNVLRRKRLRKIAQAKRKLIDERKNQDQDS